MTKYIVLRSAEDQGAPESLAGPLWEEVDTVGGEFEARHADAACLAAAEQDAREGEYIAIPARNFKPVQVKLERNPRAVVAR